MSLRILILGLAVGVCALWPQGLVLCMGESGHVEIEPGGTPCCPADHDAESQSENPDEDPHDNDCGDCRDYESPELTSAVPAPALPAPLAVAGTDALLPDVDPMSAPAADGHPPLSGADELRTVILVV